MPKTTVNLTITFDLADPDVYTDDINSWEDAAKSDLESLSIVVAELEPVIVIGDISIWYETAKEGDKPDTEFKRTSIDVLNDDPMSDR